MHLVLPVTAHLVTTHEGGIFLKKFSLKLQSGGTLCRFKQRENEVWVLETISVQKLKPRVFRTQTGKKIKPSQR